MSSIPGIVLAIVAAATFSIGAYAAEMPSSFKRGESSALAPSDTVRLKIDGMTCGGCAVSARVVLQRLEGVAKATVDYGNKTAVVVFDPDVISPARMIQALKEKLKYTAVVVAPEEHGK